MTEVNDELLPCPFCKYCGQPKAIHDYFTMSCPIVPRYQPKSALSSPIDRNAVIRECAYIAAVNGDPQIEEAILALVEQEGK